MKKSLSHLPPHKRQELHRVVKIICEQMSGVAMVILFGSYARGNWVEEVSTEGHITYEYCSDFDILVIVESPGVVHRSGLWHRLERIIDSLPLSTPVTLIGHDVNYVNKRLEEAHYFFTDLKTEGVLLYDSKKFKLARRRKLDAAERQRIAKDDFKQWFTSANEFYDNFTMNYEKRRYKNAAFQLHQATERYYATVLLVFTGYKPKTHDLKKLGGSVAGCDPAFLRVFPKATEREKRCFDLLRRAYIDARYKKDYKITRPELTYLSQRVAELAKLTKKVCRKKIESFV